MWMKGVFYLNGHGHCVSSHADENDHNRWTGKRHYTAVSSTIPTDAVGGLVLLKGDWLSVPSDFVMHTSWKTRGMLLVSCSHEIYRGLCSPLFRKGCKRRADAAHHRSSLTIRHIFRFSMKFDAHIDTYISSADIESTN